MKCKLSRLLRAAAWSFVFLVSPVFADSASPYFICMLSWTPPTMNDDGTPVSDLVGYYIYSGPTPDTLYPAYFCNADMKAITLVYQIGSTHYFGITAVNADGFESDMTPLVSKAR
jgi:hypothetical protein